MPFSVSRVPWKHAAPLLRTVRERVFICEWRIPKRIEFDRNDRHATHILVCDDKSQEPVATGRILANGEISRVAVIRKYRKLGIDKRVMQLLFAIAKENQLKEVYINCPLDTVEYFRKNNFEISGAVFMEAGLPKQRMSCAIDNISDVNLYLNH